MCVLRFVFFFFFKQKTAYEMRISDWSSDVCSSDLRLFRPVRDRGRTRASTAPVRPAEEDGARAVQAVHLSQARAVRLCDHDQGREADGREGAAGSLGHSDRKSVV